MSEGTLPAGRVLSWQHQAQKEQDMHRGKMEVSRSEGLFSHKGNSRPRRTQCANPGFKEVPTRGCSSLRRSLTDSNTPEPWRAAAWGGCESQEGNPTAPPGAPQAARDRDGGTVPWPFPETSREKAVGPFESWFCDSLAGRPGAGPPLGHRVKRDRAALQTSWAYFKA